MAAMAALSSSIRRVGHRRRLVFQPVVFWLPVLLVSLLLPLSPQWGPPSLLTSARPLSAQPNAGSIASRALVTPLVRSAFSKWMAKHGHSFKVRAGTAESEKHGLTFKGPELLQRLLVFASNLEFIRKMNARRLGFKLAANKFAHLTFDEFKQAYLGLKLPPFAPQTANSTGTSASANVSKTGAAASVDWSGVGAVTEVKDQQNCGGCWAFATVGAIESATYIKTNQLLSLSEQQLIDCDTATDSSGYANLGCNGGYVSVAMEYVINHGGLATEYEYPFISGPSGQGSTCQIIRCPHSPISSFTRVNSDEESLKAAVAQQPVAVAINVGQAFQLYSSGIFWGPCSNDPNDLNHAVLAVGYDTDSSANNYWKVKNSWGVNWGENGYIRMKRNSCNTPYGECGIAAQTYYPTV